MKLKSLAGPVAALLLMLASPAYAVTLTYTLDGPQFTTFAAPFTGSDKIIGMVSFDSTYLDAAGNGSVGTVSFNLDPGITWAFSDGHNSFNSTITTTNFAIQMAFVGFSAFGWNIDTTFGVTPAADIFALDNSRYESYYQGSFATSSTHLTSANWTLTTVPETADLSVLGLSLGFLGLARFLTRKR